MRVRTTMLIGDQAGTIGVGVGKSSEYQEAMQKARASARRHTLVVPHGETITRPVEAKFGSSRILLKPAPKGTSIKAGSVVRTVCQLAGIENIVAKQLGSRNTMNVLGATILALSKLQPKGLGSVILGELGE